MIFKQHQNRWGKCSLCSLHKYRTNIVLFRSSVGQEIPEGGLDVLFIGEAPGMDEDRQGKPFVGRAGEVLQSAIDELTEFVGKLELAPFSWGITNILACYPGKDAKGNFNRPTSEQANACRSRLEEIVEMANPSLIFLLGQSAQSYAAKICGTRTVGIYHPSYILRQGGVDSAVYRSWFNEISTKVASLYGQEKIKTLARSENKKTRVGKNRC